MKKQSWVLGITISVGISLIASLPRMMRMERIEFGPAGLSICYNLLFCVFCWIAHQLISAQAARLRIGMVPAAILSITTVSSFSFLLDFIFSFLHFSPLLVPETWGSKRPYVLLLRGLVISGLFYFITYYLHMLSEKQKNMLEIAQLKQAQLAANLSSLKAQLSPHFLFNTLNTLSTLTQEQSVKNYVSELANVYRYVLQYKDADTATLQQELDFIDSYLYIIKTRLEDAIDISIAVTKEAREKKMPPLTLQLLLENAIKHNVASTGKQLKIRIESTGEHLLEVSNNLQPKTSVSYAAGIGLDNVMQRYRLLFNEEIHIEKDRGLFLVKLPLV